MSFRLRVYSVFFLLVGGTWLAKAATWTTIDVPGAVDTVPYGINNTSDVVGVYSNSDGAQHGFLLHNGTFITLDFPGAKGTVPLDINDPGIVAGYYADGSSQFHGFLFDGQTFTKFEFPGSVGTAPTGVNNAGEVVGTYTDAGFHTHGFTWLNESFVTIDGPDSLSTALEGISNHGDIVGSALNSKHKQYYFVLNANGKFRNIGYSRQVFGINVHKMVVGFKLSFGGFKFNLATKTMVKLRFPHSLGTFCTGINDSGQIVGFYTDQGQTTHSFLRTQ